MITTVLRKLTVRPDRRSKRPSSSSCSSAFHIRNALFDFVEQDDAVRTTTHLLGELSALVVADVTGWRTERRLTVCCSRYSLISMRIRASSSSNMNSASALANSVLPTPELPKDEEPIGRRGSLKPGGCGEWRPTTLQSLCFGRRCVRTDAFPYSAIYLLLFPAFVSSECRSTLTPLRQCHAVDDQSSEFSACQASYISRNSPSTRNRSARQVAARS